MIIFLVKLCLQTSLCLQISFLKYNSSCFISWLFYSTYQLLYKMGSPSKMTSLDFLVTFPHRTERYTWRARLPATTQPQAIPTWGTLFGRLPLTDGATPGYLGQPCGAVPLPVGLQVATGIRCLVNQTQQLHSLWRTRREFVPAGQTGSRLNCAGLTLLRNAPRIIHSSECTSSDCNKKSPKFRIRNQK